MGVLCAVVAMLAATAPAEKPAAEKPAEERPAVNLVKNPGFEEGRGWQPDNWTRLDRLTSFWSRHTSKDKVDLESLKQSGGKPPGGRYLLINTDIHLSQYEERQKELDGNPNAAPPEPKPVKPPGYDTVGGTKGVAIFSDPIPVKPDAYYNVSCWCKGTWAMGDDDFAPKIFVKGYAKFGEEGEYREVVRKYLNCRADSKKGWQWFTWRRPFAPVKLVKTAKVEYVRLKIFCYWPRYEYGWDDIRFFEVPEPAEEIKSALEKDREGKHGTAVNPQEEEWLVPTPPGKDEKKGPEKEAPEGLEQLLDIVSP